MGCSIYSKCTHIDQCCQPWHALDLARDGSISSCYSELPSSFLSCFLNPHGDEWSTLSPLHSTLWIFLGQYNLLDALNTPTGPQTIPASHQLLTLYLCLSSSGPAPLNPGWRLCSFETLGSDNHVKWHRIPNKGVLSTLPWKPHDLLLTSSCVGFWFVCVIPKHLNFATF